MISFRLHPNGILGLTLTEKDKEGRIGEVTVKLEVSW